MWSLKKFWHSISLLGIITLILYRLQYLSCLDYSKVSLPLGQLLFCFNSETDNWTWRSPSQDSTSRTFRQRRLGKTRGTTWRLEQTFAESFVRSLWKLIAEGLSGKRQYGKQRLRACHKGPSLNYVISLGQWFLKSALWTTRWA